MNCNVENFPTIILNLNSDINRTFLLEFNVRVKCFLYVFQSTNLLILGRLDLQD